MNELTENQREIIDWSAARLAREKRRHDVLTSEIAEKQAELEAMTSRIAEMEADMRKLDEAFGGGANRGDEIAETTDLE